MGDEERDEIMDDEEGVASEEPSGSGESSKIVKILLYVAGGFLILILIVGISVLVSKNVHQSINEKRRDVIAAVPPPAYSTFELKDFSKTTSDIDPHFMKVELSLAYEHSVELNSELVQRRDQLRHIINLLLQSKKYEDLRTASGQLGLAEEIKSHVNVVLIKGKIKEVYFKNFVIN